MVFKPTLNLWKTDILTLFQNSISQSVSILAIISHPHFLMGSNHLSSTALQIKTITVQLPKIDICFWDFQTCAKNGDSVPLNMCCCSPSSIHYNVKTQETLWTPMSNFAGGVGAGAGQAGCICVILFVWYVWKSITVQICPKTFLHDCRNDLLTA